jgi:hypothetical protein
VRPSSIRGKPINKDPKVIQTIVDPAASGNHSIDIQVFWPDGAGPPPSIELCLHKREKQVQHLIRQ